MALDNVDVMHQRALQNCVRGSIVSQSVCVCVFFFVFGVAVGA